MPDVQVYIRARDEASTKRPSFVYESVTPCPLYGDPERAVTCQLTTNVNESVIWCDECSEQHEWMQMRKSYQSMGTSFATVWHDTDQINLTTGRVETDARKFATYLRDRAEIDGERLGMTVDYQSVDHTDKESLGVTDEGLDATHDRAVQDGRKDSRGRIIF